jgi:hypothetical protein
MAKTEVFSMYEFEMEVDEETSAGVVPGKGKIFQLCFAVTFFYNMSEDRKRQAAILDILDEHCAMTGNKYRWTQVPETSKWQFLSAGINSYTHPREWVLTNRHYLWELIYHDGEKASDASDVEVYSLNNGNTPNGDKTSILRVHFPLGALQESRAVVKTILRWAEILQPDHGYAGYSLARSHGYEHDVEAALFEYEIGQILPGVDIYDVVTHALCLGKSIKGVDWLVILSDSFLERIGGAETVRARMRERELPVWDYKSGAVLPAGKIPLAGNEAGHADMADYRHVAAIVEPLRNKHYFSGIADGMVGVLIPAPLFFNKERYQKWLARFSPQPE